MNEFRFCDPALDALEREGIETDDLLLRAAIYRQATALIHQDVPFIPLLQQRRPAVMNDDLRGYDPSPVAAPWWNAWTWDI
jgi:dipeptide transport system substrate-binding protein